jgi:hypothetical protein
VPELIDKVKIDTNPSLNFITKNETVFVSWVNTNRLNSFFCSRSNAFINLKEPPTKFKEAEPPTKFKRSTKVEKQI